MEDAFGVTVDGPLRDLRRLLYCGEWIESHVLHIYMLHAPDFLGYESAIHMAADHREIVEQGLRLKKAGNDIVTLRRRPRDPPDQRRVGGFYRAPTKARAADAGRTSWSGRATPRSRRCAGSSRASRSRSSSRTTSSCRVRHPDEYPFNEGRLVSNKGLDIAVSEFNDVFDGGARRALQRAALRGSTSAAPITSDRWPATA